MEYPEGTSTGKKAMVKIPFNYYSFSKLQIEKPIFLHQI